MPLHQNRTRCLHRCPCGTVLICMLDRCTVAEDFICAACELDNIDIYVSQLEMTHKEPTDHEKH